jgi:hypothetical protein
MMFLGAFHFDGDLDDALPAYKRLMATCPPDSLLLHMSIERENGLTVYDACPSRADFDGFTSGEDFRAALAAAGLPFPRIEPLGEVHDVRFARTIGGVGPVATVAAVETGAR